MRMQFYIVSVVNGSRLSSYIETKSHGPQIRAGSLVVFVRIHCTEKWPTSFHNIVLSESK